VAVYVLVINVAAGASPILIGKITDVSGDPLVLQYALLIAPAADFLAAVFLYLGARRIVTDMQRYQQRAAAAA
jgi:hypothetical protein